MYQINTYTGILNIYTVTYKINKKTKVTCKCSIICSYSPLFLYLLHYSIHLHARKAPKNSVFLELIQLLRN